MESANEKLAYIKTAVEDWEKRIVTGHEAMLRIKFIVEHFEADYDHYTNQGK